MELNMNLTDIRFLIGEGNLDKALEKLHSTFEETNISKHPTLHYLYNDFLVVKAQYSKLIETVRKGIISSTDEQLTLNKINSSLLDIIEKLTSEWYKKELNDDDNLDIKNIFTTGENLRIKLRLTSQEIQNGKSLNIKILKKIRCFACFGIGALSDSYMKKCEQCGGSGQSYTQKQFFPHIQYPIPCGNCTGIGYTRFYDKYSGFSIFAV